MHNFFVSVTRRIGRIRTQRRSASPRRRVVEPYPSTRVAGETEREEEGAIINNLLAEAFFEAVFLGRGINFLP